MTPEFQLELSRRVDEAVVQNIVGTTNEIREFLRREWSWPSPEGGFTALVLPSMNFDVASKLEVQEQLKRGQAPLLASIGYGLAASEELRGDQSILDAWCTGIERLSYKDIFPADRETFVFRPLELLGMALGVQHYPNLSEKVRQWFSQVVTQAIQQNIFSDSWALLLGELTAKSVGINWNLKLVLPFEECNIETSALYIWAYKDGLKEEHINSLRGRLIREYLELTEPPTNYPALAVIYSQIAPLVQQAVEQISLPVQTKPMPQNEVKSKYLPRRIHHIDESFHSQIDFAIITVREDENRAVLKRFPIQFFYQGAERSYGINLTQIADGTIYTTAIVRCIEQGTAQGQDVARDIISDLNPHWLMLVGISGGVPESEWTLGDVILASRLQDFSVHALIDGNKNEFAQTGGPMHRSIQDLLAGLPMMESYLGNWNSLESIGMPHPHISIDTEKIYGGEIWENKVKNSLSAHFEDQSSQRHPIYAVGATASSDALVKDSAVVQQWQQNSRQLLNIEMELAGVYTASRRTGRDYPILAVRGISDIVGYKRHPDWTLYACNSAASFARAILEVRPFTPTVKTAKSLTEVQS